MSDKPMTAEEIRASLDMRMPFEPRDSEKRTLLRTLHDILDTMSAREREHAELLARVERLEAKVMGDGR